MAEMNTADMLALTNARGDNFLEGNGIIVLILFLIMFGWGGNGAWGNNNAALQGSLTRAEMSDGFNMAELQRNQSDIKMQICGTEKEVLQNRYDTALGNATLQNQISENRYQSALQNQATQAQMATQCCDLKTAIHAEGEATRAMIQQNKIEELQSELNLARNVATNQTQTQNLVAQLQNMMSTMGRWYANPPYGCGCGCNCG